MSKVNDHPSINAKASGHRLALHVCSCPTRGALSEVGETAFGCARVRFSPEGDDTGSPVT
jgi:hypothetical protein